MKDIPQWAPPAAFFLVIVVVSLAANWLSREAAARRKIKALSVTPIRKARVGDVVRVTGRICEEGLGLAQNVPGSMGRPRAASQGSLGGFRGPVGQVTLPVGHTSPRA